MRNFAIMFSAVVILILFAVALGHAQAVKGPAIGTTASLTEVEKLKIENATLKNTVISLQKQLLQTQAALLEKNSDGIKATENELVVGIQKAHPGYTLAQDGTLVAVPAEKK